MEKRKCQRLPEKASGRAKEQGFPVINPNAAGIDIGSKKMWVCVPEGRDDPRRREFGVTTDELERIAAWLKKCGVTTVAMESTSIYWVTLYQILENHGLVVHLGNSKQMRNVPGRPKSDPADCRWHQKLEACGLVSPSFRPSAAICRLRSYLRHRQTLVEQNAQHIQHMQKAMREMNVLLDLAVSDVTGVSGMRIMEAIIAGQRDPKKLAELVDSRVQKKPEEIARALAGDYRPEHVFVLKQAVEAYRFVRGQIAACDREVEPYLVELERQAGRQDAPLPADGLGPQKRPRHNTPDYDVQPHLYRLTGVGLTQIPGIGEETAQGLISETGLDMSRWPTEKHFASWLDLCPSPKMSGGRVVGQARRHSQNRAGQMFRQAASSLRESKTWLGAYHRRMRAKLGPNSAKKATAHKLALIYYRMLRRREEYRDLGVEEYERRLRARTLRNLQRRARELGMELVPGPAVATGTAGAQNA